MKIGGVSLKKEYIDTIVIPRPDGDIVLNVKTVDDEKYDKIESDPIPPMLTLRGETEPKPDPNDRDYKEAVSEFWKRRQAWFIIESLSATPDLEWDTITEDPLTFVNVYDEMAKVFSPVEVVHIRDKIVQICGLSIEMIEKATADFLATKVAKED